MPFALMLGTLSKELRLQQHGNRLVASSRTSQSSGRLSLLDPMFSATSEGVYRAPAHGPWQRRVAMLVGTIFGGSGFRFPRAPELPGMRSLVRSGCPARCASCRPTRLAVQLQLTGLGASV